MTALTDVIVLKNFAITQLNGTTHTYKAEPHIQSIPTEDALNPNVQHYLTIAAAPAAPIVLTDAEKQTIIAAETAVVKSRTRK